MPQLHSVIDPKEDSGAVSRMIQKHLSKGFVLTDAVIYGTFWPEKAQRNMLVLEFTPPNPSDEKEVLRVLRANYGFPGEGSLDTIQYIFEATGGEAGSTHINEIRESVLRSTNTDEFMRRIIPKQ